MIKSYLDLSGLAHFHDKIITASITDVTRSSLTTAPSVKGTVDYVDDEIDTLASIVQTALNSKLSSVSYNNSTGVFTSSTRSGTDSTIFTADNTGGTASSCSLITSGAVNQGLASLSADTIHNINYDTTNRVITKTLGGTTSNLVLVDNTSGGTSGSTDLITSGAVNSGLSDLNALITALELRVSALEGS